MAITLHPPLQLLRKAQPAVAPSPRRESAPRLEATLTAGWLQRLARWAERQPPQHRLGSLDAYRHF
jgi:hypothetical protein